MRFEGKKIKWYYKTTGLKTTTYNPRWWGAVQLVRSEPRRFVGFREEQTECLQIYQDALPYTPVICLPGKHLKKTIWDRNVCSHRQEIWKKEKWTKYPTAEYGKYSTVSSNTIHVAIKTQANAYWVLFSEKHWSWRENMLWSQLWARSGKAGWKCARPLGVVTCGW